VPEAAWLIAGLGNPGPGHAAARHNVGFRVVAVLAAAAGAAFRGPARGALWAWALTGGRPAVLIQPQEYMNYSGPPVAAWLAALGLGPDRLVVIHDDLDLAVGRLKVAAGGGDGGHRGIRSIGEALGDLEFLRVRVGIGRPAGDDAAAYVLAAPAGHEAEALRAAEARAAEAVEAILAGGPAAAMTRFNPWPAAGPPSGGEDVGTA
jgi:PTH1 family peptidyl-tRNA hydrolase